MSFSGWLRSNSEHYLLIDAQRRVAATHNAQAPTPPRGLTERFWRQVFVPVYRLLPWGLRRRIISSLPGSHRRSWPQPKAASREAAVGSAWPKGS